jgi:glycosyltransferase involved in cell wall biosynthesis/SAM-dependent methyltransferase
VKFKESALAHKLLDGLDGIEIGGSAHNPWGLKTRNVDFTREFTPFKAAEVRICGEALPVDICAPGDQLPLEDNSVEFVISSHVIEHFPDPIKALKEWRRVVRSGGYIYVIAPHKERTFDKNRQRTTLAELIERHQTGICPDPKGAHCSVWTTEDLLELVEWLGWPIVAVQDVDDKVGNGFTVVIGVEKKDKKETPHRAKKQHLSMTFVLGPTGNTRTGGADCILEYARRFQERGHDVSITTWPQFLWLGKEPFPGLGSQIPIYYDRSAKMASLPFHFVGQTPRNFLGELDFFIRYMSLVTPAIPKADLIIAAHWGGIIPAWQSSKGKPVHFPQHYDEVFFNLDGDPSASLQGNPLIKMLCRNAFQMPVYRIANSTWLAGEFRRRFGEVVPVVTNGIDTDKFHQRPKLSESDGIIRVVTYSHPEQWKGFPDAIAAMAEVMRRCPEQESAQRMRCAHKKIEWHVYGSPHAIGPDNAFVPYRFHGALGHDDLSRLYAESDIVLCPSWYESFPLPPIEAMACGTAVITTRYGTEDYAIDGHNAIVVRPRVIGDFVTALETLIRIPDLRRRLAANGRAMAESLTWEEAMAAREELLWRIHRNEISNDILRGFDTGIVDGYGNLFERVLPDLQARDGDVFQDPTGKHYLVESGRLRELAIRAAIAADRPQPRPIDILSVSRNQKGPEIEFMSALLA